MKRLFLRLNFEINFWFAVQMSRLAKSPAYLIWSLYPKEVKKGA
jgi:hypothetical protein